MVVTNVGTATMTILKAALPAAPFSVPIPLAEGQTLDPNESLKIAIVVRPQTAAPISGTYSITADDGHGARNVALRANDGPWTGPIRTVGGCVDIYADARLDGTTVDLWPCNGSTAQQLSFGAGSTLRVGPPTSPWCLGPAGTTTAVGTRVKLFTCSGSPRQRFAWGATSRLRNPSSGLCIEPKDGSSQMGAFLVLAKCSAATYQKWDASGLVAARGELTSRLGAAHQICLTDRGGATAPGPRVEIGRCRTTVGQIVTHRFRQLRIVGQCVTAGRTGDVRWSPVTLQPCTGRPNQVLVPITGNRLRNPASALCLAVKDGDTAPRTRVRLETCRLSAAQGWRLPG
jgi:hypothetical protein